jgi:hypothetical protein
MSIVLESIGFFRWAAIKLAIKAKGSGIFNFASVKAAPKNSVSYLGCTGCYILQCTYRCQQFGQSDRPKNCRIGFKLLCGYDVCSIDARDRMHGFILFLYFKKDIPIRFKTNSNLHSIKEQFSENTLNKFPHPLAPKSGGTSTY